MLRIVRKSRERELVDALLAERERLVFLLAEQVEYLRAQVGSPTRAVTSVLEKERVSLHDFDLGSALPDDITRELTGVITDEEEELLALKQAGVINEVEYEAARERILAGPDIIE